MNEQTKIFGCKETVTRSLTVLFLLMFLPLLGVAQTPITGIVVDNKGEPIIGATVSIKGTTTGTITDVEGKYSLQAPDGAMLVFSYVGFASKEVASSMAGNIELESDAMDVEEVVVVGFGVQKKVNLTGSVASVDEDLLKGRPLTNVSSAMQGTMSGVQIRQSSGRPGGDGGTIRIRGVGTLNNSNPLVLVDGIESSMDRVDYNDVASISVLKDAASAAIYGSKAANGVVLITTKRGSEGRATVEYHGNFGWQNPTQLPEWMGSPEYAELYNEALINEGKPARWTADDIQKFKDGSSPFTHPNTDWQKLLYQGSGFMHTHNASIRGGNEFVRYMTSIGIQSQKGIIKHSAKEQFNVRSNIDANPTKKLEISMSLSYSNSNISDPTNSYVGGGSDQIIRQINVISPWIPYKNEDGGYGTIGDGNPIAWIDLNQTRNQRLHNLLAISSVKYKIIDGLSLKGQIAYNLGIEDQNEFVKDIQYNGSLYHGPNYMNQNNYFNGTFTTNVFLDYTKTIKGHTIAFMGGFMAEMYQKKDVTAYRQNFPNNELGDLDAGSTDGMQNSSFTRKTNMLSGFGRLSYDYESKYLFEANFRADASSRFAKGNRTGYFPSFSAGWRLSEENFFDGIRDVVSSAKIRASWGILGNQNISEYYPTIPILSLGQDYPFGESIIPGAATSIAKNPNLKWETTMSWGAGIDLVFIDAINFSVEYYNKTTSDILMVVPTPDMYVLTDFYDNVGKVRNQGVEIGLSFQKQFGEFMVSAGANLAYNHNEILALGGVNRIIDGQMIKQVGAPLNSYYGYETDGFFQSQQEIDDAPKQPIGGQIPGDLKFVDKNGDGVVNCDDRTILGSQDPKITYGFNLGVEAYGVDIGIFFQGSALASGYMGSEAVGFLSGDASKPSTIWRDHWTPNNTDAKYPRLQTSKNGPSTPDGVTSSFWIQNGSYLRLKNLQVGYTFPQKWTQRAKISKLRIYYSGQNLFTATDFIKGWDPEALSGRGSHYPQVMVNSMGINLTF